MAQTHVEGPARLRPTHVVDRTLSVVAGSPKGTRNVDWPIEIAYEAGRLENPKTNGNWDSTFNAEMRWLAIKEVAGWHQATIHSGVDSTQKIGAVRGSGGNIMFCEAHEDAGRKLVSVYALMAPECRVIVQRLVEDWSLPGAVREACGDSYVYTVAARVRTALDALINAQRMARRSGYVRFG